MSSNYTIILGSQSPRRQQLMRDAGFLFESVSIEVEEHFDDHLSPVEIVTTLALKKADHYPYDLKNRLLITADTVVILDQKILGKPTDRNDAINMIQSLSGKSHQVATGVCIRSEHKTFSFNNITRVTFKNLSDQEIAHYVDHYNAMDKAGAYGIQDWIGLIGVTEIKGSYYNVMGLPVHQLIEVFKQEFDYSLNYD